MFATLIGAVEIADIIVFVVLGLGLLGGLIGGLAKAFKGIFAMGAVILLSLLLVGYTISPVYSSSIGQSLDGTFKGKAEGWGVAFTSTVFIAEADGEPIMDGDKYTYCVEVDGKMVSLEEAMGDGALNKVKGKVAVLLAQRFVTPENSGDVTLAGYTAEALTTLILDLILFVVYCIVLGIVFYLLRKLCDRIFARQPRRDPYVYGEPAKRSAALVLTDKLLGAIVATGLALLTLLLVFAIIKAAAPAGSAVAQFFEKGSVAGQLYVKNPMSEMLAKILG